MSGWRAGRVVRLGLLSFLVASTVVAGWLIVEATPRLFFIKARLGLLIGLEVAYGVTLIVCLASLLVLAWLRARGVRRPCEARGLALCLSLLFALALGEGASSIVRARRASASALPTGGFHSSLGALPGPVDEIALPKEFPDRKGANDVELVVLGESSAAGIPYSLFSMSPGAIIARRLQKEIPGKTFSLHILAESGDTLEGQHRKLANLSRRPDAILIYCGHNEFTARLSASRDLDYYLDAGEPTRWERFVGRVERLSPFCGLIRSAADACRVAIPPPAHGHRELVDTPVHSRAEYDALLGDFRRRLGAIVTYAESIGALPILIAPPGNDADFEPSRSSLPPETPRAEREAFARAVETARRGESSDPEGSLQRYRALIDRHPGFAETHFRLARLLDRAGRWDEAYRNYVAARDLDGMPMRCPTAFQDVYHALANERHCPLIDGQASFHAAGRHGRLDDHLFHDGMHPSLLGQTVLAQAVLRVLHARRAFGWPEGSPSPVIDPAETARGFALGKYAWNKLCHWGIMFYDSTAPARYDPSERRAKQDAFGQAADKINAGQPPESVGLPNIGVPLRDAAAR